MRTPLPRWDGREYTAVPLRHKVSWLPLVPGLRPGSQVQSTLRQGLSLDDSPAIRSLEQKGTLWAVSPWHPGQETAVPITVTCDCGRKLQVRDEFGGQEGKCPSCGQGATSQIPFVEVPVSVSRESPALRTG